MQKLWTCSIAACEDRRWWRVEVWWRVTRLCWLCWWWHGDRSCAKLGAITSSSSSSNCSTLSNCGARPLSTPVILYNQSQLDTLSRQPGLGPSVMSLCNVFLFNVENDHNSNTLYCAVAEVRGWRVESGVGARHGQGGVGRWCCMVTHWHWGTGTSWRWGGRILRS